MEQRNPVISKAINHVGSGFHLAQRLGVSQQAVSKWLLGGKIAPSNAMRIEEITEGAVTKEDLRPDIYRPEHRQETEPA